MTGTSLDAADAALVAVSGTGRGISAEYVAHASAPLGELAAPLRALAEGAPMAAAEVARTARCFGELLAELVAGLSENPPDLCAVHGQTVCHAPPYSWQLLNPWPIAERLGCDVVFDLRGADLAAGGQGAPITPLADAVLFGSEEVDRAIVNLGGFCNITLLPAGRREAAAGADVCSCNQVLDLVARTALGRPYDTEGAAAGQGAVDPSSAAALERVLMDQATAGRSLGSGDEAGGWVREHAGRLSAEDLAATAAAAVGATISRSLIERAPGARVLLAGGGVNHAPLVRAIGVSETTAALGVPPAAREAAGMAVLGALAQDGVDITLAGVTGRRPAAARSGAWVYAGARA